MDNNDQLTDTMKLDDIPYDLQMKIGQYEFNFINETNVASFIDTYFRIICMDFQNEQLIAQIAYSIYLQDEYVTINAVSKALLEWGIPNQIETLEVDKILQIKEPTLSMLVNPLELIIILNIDEKGFVFYSSDGNVKQKLWSNCTNRFTGLTLTIEPVSISKIKLAVNNNVPDFLAANKAFLDKCMDIIVKGHKEKTGVLYNALTNLCTPLVLAFYNFKTSPIVITLMWIILNYLAAILILTGPNLWTRLTAAIFILIAYILDCCDGTLARLAKRQSSLGNYLEKVGHLTFRPIIIIAITFGLYNTDHTINIIYWGIICLCSDTIFHPIYEQHKLEQKNDRKTIIKIIDLFYPLNPNIFIVGLFANCLFAAIQVWAIAGIVLSLTIASLNIVAFFRSSTQRRFIYSSYVRKG